jgi:coenzyme F420-0:L-glutamate ligase/coenzyme F420-1:gamma-L-glutamate ligase
MTVELVPIQGIKEVDAGDDLAALIVEALGATTLRDGDVVAVTQKVVSKAEGRVVPETEGRDAWVMKEARRIVARRDDLVIAETRHGFVCANAGVDISNVPKGFVSLLPEDPDASADRIRDRVRELTGRDVGVVVTDTFGRPWRRGLVNVAVGCAGLPAVVDLRGRPDSFDRLLETTVVAVADEVAAAAGLVTGKAEGIPAVVVRGIRGGDTSGSARDLVRPPDEDLFRASPLQAISDRRSVRRFGPGGIPRSVLLEAVAASLTAPVPHASRHKSRPWLWFVLDSAAARRRLLAAMASAWERDLREDGVADDVIARRIAGSERFLGEASALAVPALSLAVADAYPDDRRREAEREMFLLATGAAVENFMLALNAQGYGSCWVSSTLFCKEEVREALGLADEWLPMGSIAAGPLPEDPPPPRPPIDPEEQLEIL